MTTELSLWQEFLKVAKKEVGTPVVQTWFNSVGIHRIDQQNEKITFSVPNQFVLSWIKRNYFFLFKNFFQASFGKADLDLDFVIEKNNSEVIIESPETTTSIAAQALTTALPSAPTQNKSFSNEPNIGPLFSLLAKPDIETTKEGKVSKKNNLNNRYFFENFVVGPNNHLAYSAAIAVAQGMSKKYNPLLIYGKTGLGKTHLLNCIGNEYKKNYPDAKVIYKTSDSFIEEFIRAIRQDKSQSFREKYQKIDLLLLDDIQFLSQKEQTQEAFFNIFNKMHTDKKQIVLTSDQQPVEIKGLHERLQSRLSWGLIADISMPSLETKTAILLKKAEELKIKLDQNVAEYISLKMGSNIREIEGILTKLSAMTILSGHPINKEMVDKIAYGSGPNPAEKYSSMNPNDILNIVTKGFGISLSDICSKSRGDHVAQARQVGAYLLKKYTTHSLKTIGNFLGGRNHSTVIHSIHQIEDRIKTDTLLARKIKDLEDNFTCN